MVVIYHSLGRHCVCNIYYVFRVCSVLLLYSSLLDAYLTFTSFFWGGLHHALALPVSPKNKRKEIMSVLFFSLTSLTTVCMKNDRMIIERWLDDR